MKKLTVLLTVFSIIFLLCSCSGKADAEKAKADILSFCNVQRQKEGIGELALDGELCEAAQVRAREISMPESFKHIRPDGSGCFTVLKMNYTKAGENLAKGKPDGQEIVDAWMNSEEHRKNITDAQFTRAGIASFEKNGEYYWVMLYVG